MTKSHYIPPFPRENDIILFLRLLASAAHRTERIGCYYTAINLHRHINDWGGMITKIKKEFSQYHHETLTVDKNKTIPFYYYTHIESNTKQPNTLTYHCYLFFNVSNHKTTCDETWNSALKETIQKALIGYPVSFSPSTFCLTWEREALPTRAAIRFLMTHLKTTFVHKGYAPLNNIGERFIRNNRRHVDTIWPKLLMQNSLRWLYQLRLSAPIRYVNGKLAVELQKSSTSIPAHWGSIIDSLYLPRCKYTILTFLNTPKPDPVIVLPPVTHSGPLQRLRMAATKTPLTELKQLHVNDTLTLGIFRVYKKGEYVRSVTLGTVLLTLGNVSNREKLADVLGGDTLKLGRVNATITAIKDNEITLNVKDKYITLYPSQHTLLAPSQHDYTCRERYAWVNKLPNKKEIYYELEIILHECLKRKKARLLFQDDLTDWVRVLYQNDTQIKLPLDEYVNWLQVEYAESY